jgi:hypothetical protein
MSEMRTIRLPISGFGVAPSQASIEVRSLSGRERLRRAGLAPLVGLGIAIAVLPIPIVHLAVPPVALIGGIVMGLRRATQRELFETAHGPCPFCGTDQTLGVNGAPFHLPRTLSCRSCRKPLTLGAI